MNEQPEIIRPSPRSLDALRRFAKPRGREQIEQCELCSAELAADHAHLVEPTTRQILCACDACALLFGEHEGQKFRRVPRDMYALPDLRLTDTQWGSLGIPIGLAFFLYSTPLEKVAAIYPSPAGPTESLLDPEAWQDIVRENTVLNDMEPDVQALLVNRIGSARDHYLAPIDKCYELVGLVRSHWHGFSGGEDVWREITGFFENLERTAERRSPKPKRRLAANERQ